MANDHGVLGSGGLSPAKEPGDPMMVQSAALSDQNASEHDDVDDNDDFKLSDEQVEALAKLGVATAILAVQKGIKLYRGELTRRQAKALTDIKDLEEPLENEPDIYASERMIVMRSDFYRIRQDFTSIISMNHLLAQTGDSQSVCAFLQLARQSLKKGAPKKKGASNLSSASAYLSYADMTIIRLYSKERLSARANDVAYRLSQWPGIRPEAAAERIQKALAKSSTDSEEALKIAVNDGLQLLYQLESSSHQSDTVRLSGLQLARGFIIVSLALLVLVSPILLNWPYNSSKHPTISNWPAGFMRHYPVVLQEYLTVMGICVLGAVGGALSGLLTARGSAGRLMTMRSERIQLTMKPLVGGMVAVALYLLLSWNVLTGIVVTNAGTYLSIALIAGFSERFFLRFLRVNPEPEVRALGAGTTPGANSSTIPGRSKSDYEYQAASS